MFLQKLFKILANKNWVNFNGEILLADDVHISIQNRAFRYGDGLFETMRINSKDEIPFITAHLQRIKNSSNFLKIKFPEVLTETFILNSAKNLREKMDTQSALKLKLSLFRTGDGNFAVFKPSSMFLLEAIILENNQYQVLSKGLQIGINPYPVIRTNALLNGHKTMNALPYVLGATYAVENNLTECLLLNEKSQIVEGIHNNAFFVFENVIKTPPLSSGALNGVMRRYLISNIPRLGFSILEDDVLPADLTNVQEIFFSNAVQGVSWVSGLDKRRFTHATSDLIVKKLLNQF